ncbi:MAG: hypothetical protein QNJ89_00170 [Acidimicrobiia bacterium]|nr:hypothetical protein [Acidimicrobiia bacterium]
MSASDDMDIERLLAAAGFDFAVVQRCPLVGCEICDADEVPAAA